MSTPTQSVSPEISESRVLKGGLVLAAGLIIAQVTGFFRQVAVAFLLGTGHQADALAAGIAPVELWWSVVAVSIIFGFVPKFTSGPSGPAAFFNEVLKPVSRLALVSTVFFLVSADVLVRLFAPGLNGEAADSAAGLLRVFSLAPVALGCSFVYSAFLMANRSFVVPSLHQAAVNLATVAGAFLLHARYGALGFAIGYSSGAWLQLAVAHLCARDLIRQQRQSGAITGQRRRLGLLDLLRGPAPISGQALAVELNNAVSRAYASTFGTGMTAAFEYGFKLFRVPLALLVVPLSQSLLPEISSRQSSPAERQSALRAAMRVAWLLTAAGGAIMVVMIVFREPLVRLLFERGEFSKESTQAVATILLGYMPLILGRGISEFLSRTLFGMGKYRIPLAATSMALAINLLVCTILPNRYPVLIGLGAVLGFLAGAIVIVTYMRRLRLAGDSLPATVQDRMGPAPATVPYRGRSST